MGNVNEKVSAVSTTAPAATIKPASEAMKMKPCCACPETKRLRDECIMQNGQENCGHLIEAHKACMRTLGFNI